MLAYEDFTGIMNFEDEDDYLEDVPELNSPRANPPSHDYEEDVHAAREQHSE